MTTLDISQEHEKHSSADTRWMRVCGAVARLFGVPACGVVLRDGESYVTEINLTSRDKVVRRSLRRARSTALTVLDTHRPAFVPDLCATDAIRNTKVPDGVIAIGVAPLDVGGIAGALWVGDTEPRAWTERDRARLEDAAQILGDILPLVTSEVPPSQNGQPAAAERARRSATILIVEDDHAVRTFARRALQGLGHRVFEADGADGAFEVIDQAIEPVDLVITDIVMPGMSGRELAVRLSIEHPNVRLLLMSGHSDEASDVQRDGGFPFLQKPFSMEHLVACVARALEGA